jgi:hypothetical protein
MPIFEYKCKDCGTVDFGKSKGQQAQVRQVRRSNMLKMLSALR